MTRQAVMERLLYIALLLVFIAVGLGLYVAFSVETKIDTELKTQTTELQAIKKIDQDLQSGIDQLKDSNNQQTGYLQCLLTAQHLGDFPGNCQPPATVAPIQTNSAPTAPPAPSAPATQPVATHAQATPQATPAPAPSLGQRIGGLLKKLGIGLP